jgi:uracil-DNA glycosylase
MAMSVPSACAAVPTVSAETGKLPEGVSYDDGMLVIAPERSKELSLAQAFLLVVLCTDWMPVIGERKVMEGLEFASDQFRRTNAQYIPSALEIASAFVWTPLSAVRVVIIGMDPYNDPGVPVGAAFSIRKGVKLTASLLNIFEVYSKTLGYPTPTHGCLMKWALQGVLLLNAYLTVAPGGKSGEHANTWNTFSHPFIRTLSARKPLTAVLWGKDAQALRKEFKGDGHVFIEAPHPAARKGEYLAGCDSFRQVNDALVKRGERPIRWRLD